MSQNARKGTGSARFLTRPLPVRQAPVLPDDCDGRGQVAPLACFTEALADRRLAAD
jgi:hypothetical protein